MPHITRNRKYSRSSGTSNKGPVVVLFPVRDLSNSDRIERVGATPAGRPVKRKEERPAMFLWRPLST